MLMSKDSFYYQGFKLLYFIILNSYVVSIYGLVAYLNNKFITVVMGVFCLFVYFSAVDLFYTHLFITHGN